MKLKLPKPKHRADYFILKLLIIFGILAGISSLLNGIFILATDLITGAGYLFAVFVIIRALLILYGIVSDHQKSH